MQLKAHANRFLLAKLVRCWAAIAAAFGVEHHQAENEVREAVLTAGIRGCNDSGVPVLRPPREKPMCTWSSSPFLALCFHSTTVTKNDPTLEKVRVVFLLVRNNPILPGLISVYHGL